MFLLAITDTYLASAGLMLLPRYMDTSSLFGKLRYILWTQLSLFGQVSTFLGMYNMASLRLEPLK